MPTLMRASPMLMSDITGCKLSKLGLNKIGSQKTFLQYFFTFTIFLVSAENWKWLMYFNINIKEHKWKHNFFVVSWENGLISLLPPPPPPKKKKKKSVVTLSQCVCVWGGGGGGGGVLCQLEFRLLVDLTMLVRLWRRGQTKCNTPLMLATSVFGLIL